jgi:mannosyltransferase
MKLRHRQRLPLLLILLAGTALRLFRLGADSLWYDETVSTYLAGSRLSDLLRHTAGDIHPPGYYILLRGWLVLMGYPTGHADARGIGLEFSAAFFSLFFGVLLIALVYALARRVANHQVGLIAALLVALSPYNVWYSQEVRMYTLGAALGVIVVYALLRIGQGTGVGDQGTGVRNQESGSKGSIGGWWAVYAFAAAAGMYTLYYFVFLLIPLNLWVLWQIAYGKWQMAGSKSQPPSRQLPASSFQFPAWLLANLAAALLYAPWIPVAYRQATNPPVPPWRTAPELWHALRESWTALSLGQSVPSWLWPALVLTLGLYGLGLVALRQMANGKWQMADRRSQIADSRLLSGIALLPLATLGPLALILLVSLVTPLYHVRYLFTYSPPFYVVMAAGLVWLLRRSKVVFAVALGVWLAAAGVTQHAYWLDPAYRADDHRAAVRFMREHWRPGDVVLVNAGWPYTALTTYWDGPIATRSRLTGDLPATPDDPNALVMVTAGHVDGDPGLGWDDPRSDFFAMPADVAQGQIAALFDRFERVWQYRIYDTVNDPGGKVRGWLAEDGQLADDQVFAGEANMRVQRFVPRQGAAAEPDWPSAAFGTDLSLRVGPLPGQITSGETLYPALDWEFTGQPVDREASPGDFATSIRLIGPDGAIWAQPPDERPSGPMLPASQWTEDQAYRQTLKLPVPAGTPPGQYAVELVVYDPATGQPWPNQTGDLALTSNGLRLGEVTVVRPDPSPPTQPALATFGPLALIEATSPATTVAPGGQVPVELLWQTAETPGEPLVVVVQLQDESSRVAAGLEAQPLDGRYPTQNWTASELVRDRHTLTLPPDLAPGRYRLIVGVYRAADRARLETKAGLFGKSDHWVVTTVDVK